MKMKLIPDKQILLFVRIKGKKGIRELQAVLDTGSEYSRIPLGIARQLGYEAYIDTEIEAGVGKSVVTQGLIFEANEIVIEEITVADLVAKNVKALAYDLPRIAGVEALLGINFLKNFRTTIDYKKGYLSIEPF